MDEVRYTLVADGSSDRALIPILDWLILEQGKASTVQGTAADFRRTRKPRNLADKITIALELFPCDLLFVHRDAERQDPDLRYEEISEATQTALKNRNKPPDVICVVPVKMQEAWMLFDESAIRAAAANPNGTSSLSLPSLGDLERPICGGRNLLQTIVSGSTLA